MCGLGGSGALGLCDRHCVTDPPSPIHNGAPCVCIVDWLKAQPVTCWYLLHLTGIYYQLRASFSVAVVGCAKTNRGFFVTKYY